ncbi:MAG: HAMP domain-containing histidine kinase [Chloroflexi bacterium]|nr:HAMP domain-containing histidine kinase [Chloroflexota bacterium]
MNNRQERERLEELFKNLERLKAGAPGDVPAVSLGAEQSGGHLPEPKKPIQEESVPRSSEGHNPGVVREPSHGRNSNLSLYEKERTGFSFTDGRLMAVDDPVSTLAGQNILTAPLVIGSDVIGEVQITPRPDRQPKGYETQLMEAVAKQASVQIQNLKLLAEAERSRAEAEAATRRFVHEGWDSYLDAIQRQERIGYIYDQSSVSPHHDDLHPAEGIQVPVKIVDEQVGLVYVEPNSTDSLSQSDTALIKAVADQVAQQVENIRLLAEASRALAAAEEMMRRLTQENWQNYASDHAESGFAFVYDALQVISLDEPLVETELDLVNPLTVQGEVIGHLGITRTRELSPEDVHLATALASQVSIHLETLRLTEELQKRALELQELDRLKNAFLANMSHELRTPLNSILGFTDVMLEGLDGELTEYMETDLRLIQKNGQHLLHLINDVLDMAKIESGRMNLHPETFKVHGILEEVCSITSSLASEKNISLFIEDNSDRDIEIYADNTRVRQIMINLVNNAIKFTEQGRIAISVKPVDGARVLITIKDTGIGIPPDKLDLIFQEFTQVDSSTTRKVGGTGLGLPISRRLAEMHGGRLWAESTGIEGEGSTFFVELPVEARITEIVEAQEKQNGNAEIS